MRDKYHRKQIQRGCIKTIKFNMQQREISYDSMLRYILKY